MGTLLGSERLLASLMTHTPFRVPIFSTQTPPIIGCTPLEGARIADSSPKEKSPRWGTLDLIRRLVILFKQRTEAATPLA